MLPVSLESATERMMSPISIAREVFGNDFVDHFGGTRRHEVKMWNEAVTNWEGMLLHRCDKEADISPIFAVERYLELA